MQSTVITTTLLASPTRLATLPPTSNSQTSSTRTPFPISHLPYELRQLIYTFYIASLPKTLITPNTATLPYPTLTPLSQASPFLLHDTSPVLFYQNATFSFSSPEALKIFASAITDRKKDVRKVEVIYGRYDKPSERDWVHLLMENFPAVEEVAFGVEKCKERDRGYQSFGNWWECVRDAVREGLSSERSRKRVWLRVEDGEWGVQEIVCC